MPWVSIYGSRSWCRAGLSSTKWSTPIPASGSAFVSPAQRVVVRMRGILDARSQPLCPTAGGSTAFRQAGPPRHSGATLSLRCGSLPPPHFHGALPQRDAAAMGPAHIPARSDYPPSRACLGRPACRTLCAKPDAAGQQRYAAPGDPTTRPPALHSGCRDRDRRLGLATQSALWNIDLRSGETPNHRPLARPGAGNRSSLAVPAATDHHCRPGPGWLLCSGRSQGPSNSDAGRRSLAPDGECEPGLR